MSKLARKPIVIPKDIKCIVEDQILSFVKANNKVVYPVDKSVTIVLQDDNLSFKINVVNQISKAFLGTTHVRVANIVKGLSVGFTEELQLVGIGYSVVKEGNSLLLNVGKSHPVRYQIPTGVTIEVPDKTTIKISSIDKQIVGDVAQRIVEFRKPDPYRGKGIRYKNRIYKLKEVKK